MRAEIDCFGDVRLRELSPIVADTLRRLPELLQSDDEKVRDRLLPKAYEDEPHRSEWQRLAVPELEHLFASRVEIVEKDLENLEVEESAVDTGLVTFCLRIPARHRTAWESALTGGSHAVFLLEGLEAADIEGEPGMLGDPARDLGLLRLHCLNWVLSLLLEASTDPTDPTDAGAGGP